MTLTLDEVRMVEAPDDLDKELVRSWVYALRSGRYNQCRATMSATQPDGTTAYCCLGVLSAVAVGDFAPAGKYPHPGVAKLLGFNYDRESFVRFRINDPHELQDGYDIARLNDKEEWSFNQIADLIERDWL